MSPALHTFGKTSRTVQEQEADVLHTPERRAAGNWRKTLHLIGWHQAQFLVCSLQAAGNV